MTDETSRRHGLEYESRQSYRALYYGHTDYHMPIKSVMHACIPRVGPGRKHEILAIRVSYSSVAILGCLIGQRSILFTDHACLWIESDRA